MIKNLVIIIVCALAFTVADCIYDSLVFYKTHLALNGYKDFWHLLKYIMRISLFFFSIFTYIEYKRSKKDTVLTIAVLLLICLGVWNILFSVDPLVWYRLDESIHISTGIEWLDRLIGIHF